MFIKQLNKSYCIFNWDEEEWKETSLGNIICEDCGYVEVKIMINIGMMD